MNKIELNLNIPTDQKNKIPSARIKTMGKLIELVKSRNLPDAVCADVIKELKNFPDGSYDYAWGMLDGIISRVVTKHPIEIKEETNEF